MLQRTFRWTAYGVSALIILSMLTFLIAIGLGDTPAAEAFIDLTAALWCLGFPIAAAMAFSGIRLIQRGMQKQKIEYSTEIVDEDQRLNRIMSRLSVDERLYLRNLIASKRMGLASDGELTALDDLLNQYDQ